jgi:hypothetical protein
MIKRYDIRPRRKRAGSGPGDGPSDAEVEPTTEATITAVVHKETV